MILRYLILVGILLLTTGVTYKPAMPWTQEKHEQMVQQVASHRHQVDPAQYPIQDVSQIIVQFPDGKVPLFSYGSLLNEESARKTVSEEVYNTYQPAVAFGVTKVFDRHVPGAKHWGEPEKVNDTAMLNVFFTGDDRDITNGVLFYTDQSNLEELIKREKGYDLMPVSVVLWEEAVDTKGKPKVITAYIFMAPEENPAGELYVSKCINPVPGYTFASKEGAAQYGDAFLELWMATTLLADRETPYIEWEHDPDLDMKESMACQIED